MGSRSIVRGVGAIIGLGLVLLGCSGTSENKPKKETGTSCKAGVKRCDGQTVKLCAKDGKKETVDDTCSSSQTCSSGACVDIACAPGTRFCKDGAIRKCDDSGASSVVTEVCAPGLFCREEDDDASCSSQACTPNQPLCDGSKATTCDSSGAGPKPDGTDCSDNKQACYQGACRDVACTSGTKLCQHDDVYLCAANGTDMTLIADCSPAEVCDGDMGSCRPKACEPNKVSCDASRVVTCNAYGSAFTVGGTDCLAEGKTCISGSCQKQTCASNARFCKDGDVYLCDNSGVNSSLAEDCKSDTRCQAFGGSSAYCQPNDCVPGKYVCWDNSVKLCNADGSLPPESTFCGNDQYCENGACKDRGCTNDTYVCKDNDIYYCQFNGPPQLQQTCGEDTACKLANFGATCAPLPCAPGDSVCFGNKVGVCAANGQTLGSVTEDCSATTSICTTDLKCAKTATDTLGSAEQPETDAGDSILGDVIAVTSARKLTELQLRVVLTGTHELRWVIYEQSGTTFVAKVDKLVTTGEASGFISSGPLSFALKAGKSYLLGVAISGSAFVSYFDTAPFPQSASFGTLQGRVSSYYSSTIDAGNVFTEGLYYMKVTTEP